MKKLLFGGCLLMLLASCTESKKADAPVLTLSGLDPQLFERTYDGQETHLISLTNANGMEVCITNLGGRIVSVMVPDKTGKMQDVVLGFDSVGAYRPDVNASDFGAAIGRYANRINQGKLVIGGDSIQLPQNNFGHCLHGGPEGWQYKIFGVGTTTPNSVELLIDSPDGDMNFPGHVNATVTYTLTDDNAIDIVYGGTTDKETVLNMTNHSYFNLSGDASRDILDHVLMVDADGFTPVDATMMTSGEITPVQDTPMDFRSAKVVGQDINQTDFEQIQFGTGFDHSWVLNTRGDETMVCARLECPSTGIVMEVFTNEPGIQVYSGNFLDGSVVGKKGIAYNQRHAICLETGKYPDSPNKNWPECNTYLKPGEKYYSRCIYKFSVNP
ncbi:MAG: galactose mutarotase [Bacteroidaceae bacterium]|nr:galactose mutarotase [Bacteroidaceae bacterium]